jgi:hypothetical protein
MVKISLDVGLWPSIFFKALEAHISGMWCVNTVFILIAKMCLVWFWLKPLFSIENI